MKRAVSGIVLMLLLTSLLTLAFNIQLVKAKTIIVPDHYSTIQQAINAANPRDTIYVKAGTYYENVVVDKIVSLIGENRENTIIDGGRKGNVINVTENNVVIEGLTIRNSGILKGENGVVIQGSNVIIQNNYITSNQYGIRLGGFNNTVSGNIIRNNNLLGILFTGYKWSSAKCTISENMIVQNGESGIGLMNAHNNTLFGNHISYNGFDGIGLGSSKNNIILGNTVTDNSKDGIHLTDSLGNMFSDNTIMSNYENGIYLDYRSKNNTVSVNTIKLNRHNGIRVYGSSNNTVSGNNITYNKAWGISLSYSSNNKIFHNNFVNNTFKGALSEWEINVWDDGYPSGGNYWSDYKGVDANEDGIGDSPYVIDTDDRDRYPLMKPWTMENRLPTCAIKLQKEGVEINEIDVGEFFDIYVGDSTDDTGIKQVRFSSDDNQDGNPAGEWTQWYDWDISSGDWDASNKIKHWAFATEGNKEVWAEVKDDIGQTNRAFANIYVTGLPPTENQRPIAYAGLDQSVFSGDVVWFDGSNSEDPDGTIVSYRWNFGDGATAEGKRVSHRFRGAQNEPKTYTVTLTVEDNDGAKGTDTVQVNVALLEKTVKIFTRAYVPIGEMTVTYNWVDEINGENIYMVSKIRVVTKGFTGVCKPRIFDQQGQTMWSDYLLIGPGKPYVKDYVSPFTVSRLGKSATITTLTFRDGSFEGMRVRGSDSMGIYMSGIDIISALIEGVKRATDWLLDRLQPYLDVDDILKLAGVETWDYPVVFSKSSSTQFYPETAEAPGTQLETPELYLAYLRSPGELRVYDSQGLVTGLVNGEVKENIPNSTYINNTVMILSPSGSYRYEVAGTKDGSYGLIVASLIQGESNTFTATNLPISTNAIHQYTIDWIALSQGQKGATVQIDSNGDGTFEKTFTAGSELTRDEFLLQVPFAEAFPMWIVGVSVATGAIVATAIAVFWKKRKQHPTKE